MGVVTRTKNRSSHQAIELGLSNVHFNVGTTTTIETSIKRWNAESKMADNGQKNGHISKPVDHKWMAETNLGLSLSTDQLKLVIICYQMPLC